MKKHWISKMLAGGLFVLLIGLTFTIQKVSSQNTTDGTRPIPGGSTPTKNAQVLTGFTVQEISLKMVDVGKGLGVKCMFCHNVNNFSSDEKNDKKTARKMLKMVKDINDNYFNYDKAPKITCFTCHRGKQEPVHKPNEEKK